MPQNIPIKYKRSNTIIKIGQTEKNIFLNFTLKFLSYIQQSAIKINKKFVMAIEVGIDTPNKTKIICCDLENNVVINIKLFYLIFLIKCYHISENLVITLLLF